MQTICFLVIISVLIAIYIITLKEKKDSCFEFKTSLSQTECLKKLNQKTEYNGIYSCIMNESTLVVSSSRNNTGYRIELYDENNITTIKLYVPITRNNESFYYRNKLNEYFNYILSDTYQ